MGYAILCEFLYEVNVIAPELILSASILEFADY